MGLSRKLVVKFLTSIFLLFVLISFVVIGLFSLEYRNRNQSNPDPAELLNDIPAKTSINNGVASVTPEILNTIKSAKGWLQIIDATGKEIFIFNKPKTIPSQYSPGQLVYYNKFPKATGYQMYTWYSTIGDQQYTWIYGTQYNIISSEINYKTEVIIGLICILLTLIIATVYGIRLGTPLLHILKWIDNISKGIYKEPLNAKGEPKSRKKSSNKLRKSYETHKDIIVAVENLSNTIKINEENKAILDKSREEWIAGVSHDIKTPLSSVKGYADLLNSNKYHFSEEDVLNFGRIISEKATYIEELIEDMNLTFQLKNKAFIIKPELHNIVELVRTSIIDFINDQRYYGTTIIFNNEEEENIIYPVDSKWFKRAVDNLLANALEHNEKDTVINIKVEKQLKEFAYPTVSIKIVDNGKGMDKETLEHLFDRYYRGTNTDDRRVKGSGLGTAIAKQLIVAHDGSIVVNSSPGEGTEICISFPAKN